MLIFFSLNFIWKKISNLQKITERVQHIFLWSYALHLDSSVINILPYLLYYPPTHMHTLILLFFDPLTVSGIIIFTSKYFSHVFLQSNNVLFL